MKNREIRDIVTGMVLGTVFGLAELLFVSHPIFFVWYPIYMGVGLVRYRMAVRRTRMAVERR